MLPISLSALLDLFTNLQYPNSKVNYSDFYSCRVFVKSNIVISKDAKGHLIADMLSMFIDAETFEGPMFHTSMWRNDVDLTGKRVAIIGTGATSVQIVPEIAEKVAELHVFQRTAAWSPPKSLFDYSERTKVNINSKFDIVI